MTDLVKRDPFRSLFSFPRFLDDFDFGSQRGLKIHEDDKNVIVEAVIAGVPAKDVEVHIEDGVLTIKAEKSEEKESKDEHQSSTYQYYYTAALSGGQWDKADAEVEDGVLTLTIPKTEAARPRKVTVKAKTKK
jgi:HSP20 family protein